MSRRIEITLPDGSRVVAVADVSSGRATVEIDGETFAFDTTSVRPGLARFDGRQLLVGHPAFQAACDCRDVPRHAAGAPHAGAEGAELRAPFPGKVAKLLVAGPGAVAKGTPLVVLEAMKMEFTYAAPADLEIEKVLVQEGQVLEKGAAFFEHRPAPAKS